MDISEQLEETVTQNFNISIYKNDIPIIEVFTSDVALIKVGPEEKEFRLHTKLLSHNSGYFEGALRSQCTEGLNRTFTLNDIKVTTFCAFAGWLYTHSLSMLGSWQKQMLHTSNALLVIFIDLYVFADRFLVQGLKVSTLNFLIKKLNEFKILPYLAIVTAFKNLPEEDPLLDVVVDAYYRTAKRTRIESDDPTRTNFSTVPPAFLRRAMARYDDLMPRNWTTMEAADYMDDKAGDFQGEDDQERPRKKRRIAF